MTSWNQPICYADWDRLNPDRPIAPERRTATGPREHCSWCGDVTASGIYVRAHPSEVPYPPKQDSP